VQQVEPSSTAAAPQIRLPLRGVITSDWLRQHMRERGGVMNVTTRMVIAG
jgi:hypothetical protein